MKIHNLFPGSPEWDAFRLEHGGASEAAAMLGMDPLVSRSALLRAKHTTLARELSDWLQAHILDKGHEVEARARPHAEAFIDEDLYPAVLSAGYPSASTDGLTLEGRIVWEHKQWSEERAACLRAGRLPEKDVPQAQQAMMVSGADRCLFTVSDGTPEKMLHLWVDPDPAWFQRLREGWAQFQRDLAAYELPPDSDPAPVGKAPQTLPALRIEVTGKVTASNLAEFKTTALEAIRSVNRDLKTDSDFADAEQAVKWCDEVESRLKAAKQHALSQTADIDALFSTIDDIVAESKRVRLDLTKVVDRRKVEVKEAAIVKARKALDEHIARLNAEIAPIRLGPVDADFAAAIKGLRTVASMQDRLDVVLSGAKIAADIDARQLRANLLLFKEEAIGHEFLFSDLGQVVHKSPDDFTLLLRSRINGHKMAEAAKERERQVAEAARIAAAEQRAREQEAARIAELQRQQEIAARAEEAKRIERENDAAAALRTSLVPPEQAALIERGRVIVNDIIAAEILSDAVKACRPDEPATLSLGAICGRLGFTVSGDFLRDALHVAPAKTDKRALLFSESQYQTICRQLVSHVGAMAELYAGETA